MTNDESKRTDFASIRESQRDSALQPRVATQELPWVNGIKFPSTPTGLWQIPRAAGENEMATTALRLEIFCGRCPRVARSSQPWALGRNPVGIRPWPRAAASVTRRFVRSSICRIFLRISRGIMGKQNYECRMMNWRGQFSWLFQFANVFTKLLNCQWRFNAMNHRMTIWANRN